MQKSIRTTITQIIFCVVLLSATIAQATNTPVLHCLTTQANGNILITWEPVTTTLGFTRYEIYKNGSSVVGVVSSITGNTITDTQANGNVVGNQYLVAAVYNLLTYNYSAPMYSMLLTATSTATTNLGTVNLAWNGLPIPSSGTSDYITYSDYNTATMQPFGTPGFTTTQTQSISTCNSTISYQVRVTDALGCISQSNIVTGVFSQLGNVVSNPDLRCASVLPNGNVQLTWLTPTSSGADFGAYAIYKGNTIIDSIANFSDKSYTDISANANIQSYSYHVTSYSGCSGQQTSNSPVTTLSTIFLALASPAPNSCQLSWTPLPLQPSSFPFYQVNRNLNGFSSIISNSSNFQYLDANVAGSGTAYYQISVPDNSGCTSYSNTSQGCNVTALADLSATNCNLKITFNNYANVYDLEMPCLTNKVLGIDIYNAMGQLTVTLQPTKNATGTFIVAKNKLNQGLNLYVVNTTHQAYSGKIIVR